MSPDSVGHKQKHKVIVNNSVKSKINSNENENSKILRQPEEALINYLNLTKESIIFLNNEKSLIKIILQIIINYGIN